MFLNLKVNGEFDVEMFEAWIAKIWIRRVYEKSDMNALIRLVSPHRSIIIKLSS